MGRNYLQRKKGNTELDDVMNQYNEYLFEPNFQAWAYGPVDENVYKEYKNNKKIDGKLAQSFYSSQPELVQEFLKTVPTQIYNCSDFGLVDLSHRDKAWEENYNESDNFHNNVINPDDIIKEYGEK